MWLILCTSTLFLIFISFRLRNSQIRRQYLEMINDLSKDTDNESQSQTDIGNVPLVLGRLCVFWTIGKEHCVWSCSGCCLLWPRSDTCHFHSQLTGQSTLHSPAQLQVGHPTMSPGGREPGIFAKSSACVCQALSEVQAHVLPLRSVPSHWRVLYGNRQIQERFMRSLVKRAQEHIWGEASIIHKESQEAF